MDLDRVPGVSVDADLVARLAAEVRTGAGDSGVRGSGPGLGSCRSSTPPPAIQFGRPLAKFQAVQHLISDIAAEAALARSATEAALPAAVASDWSAPNLEFLVAVARSCAGHAASVVVRNAHQVLGAIGTTREHSLHLFTRAALAWRSEFGSVRYWDDQVTDCALRRRCRRAVGPDHRLSSRVPLTGQLRCHPGHTGVDSLP